VIRKYQVHNGIELPNKCVTVMLLTQLMRWYPFQRQSQKNNGYISVPTRTKFSSKYPVEVTIAEYIGHGYEGTFNIKGYVVLSPQIFSRVVKKK